MLPALDEEREEEANAKGIHGERRSRSFDRSFGLWGQLRLAERHIYFDFGLDLAWVDSR